MEIAEDRRRLSIVSEITPICIDNAPIAATPPRRPLYIAVMFVNIAKLVAINTASVAILVGCSGSQPRPDLDQDRILVFSKTAGFRHSSIPAGIKCVREILSPAIQVDATEDASVFTLENLDRYGAVVFLSTTGDVLDEQQQAAFADYIEGGGGFVGIHAASDTEHFWPWFAQMIGAHFSGHPPVQEAVIIVEDKEHPTSSFLPDRWIRTDEWYRFNRNPRTVEGIKVLAALDESTYQGGGMNGDHPCIWWRTMGKGRCWYTAGGHTEESFSEPLFREQLRMAIVWVATPMWSGTSKARR